MVVGDEGRGMEHIASLCPSPVVPHRRTGNAQFPLVRVCTILSAIVNISVKNCLKLGSRIFYSSRNTVVWWTHYCLSQALSTTKQSMRLGGHLDRLTLLHTYWIRLHNIIWPIILFTNLFILLDFILLYYWMLRDWQRVSENR